MKLQDIKEIKVSDTCYGEIVEINNVDIVDIDKEDLIEIITEAILTDANSELLLADLLVTTAEWIAKDSIHSRDEYCHTCSHNNTMTTYIINS